MDTQAQQTAAMLCTVVAVQCSSNMGETCSLESVGTARQLVLSNAFLTTPDIFGLTNHQTPKRRSFRKHSITGCFGSISRTVPKQTLAI